MTTTKKDLPAGCKVVRKKAWPGESRITYRVMCGESAEATLELYEAEGAHEGRGIRDGDWIVLDVVVAKSLRRKGAMTKLYEAAAADSCRTGRRIVSRDRIPGAFSQQFWEKQDRKGRVRRYGAGNGAIYVLRCKDANNLSGLSAPRKRCPAGTRRHTAKNGTVTCRPRKR